MPFLVVADLSTAIADGLPRVHRDRKGAWVILIIDATSAKVLHNMKGYSLLVGCLMSQQHASVSQGRICSDNLTCCHTEIEVADQTFYLT